MQKGRRVGYVQVVEATDSYEDFVIAINAAIQTQFDLGVGVYDIKYTLVELRADVTYSALIMFDDQRGPDPEPA